MPTAFESVFALGQLVDDAHRGAAPGELERRRQPDRAGTHHQDLGSLGHSASLALQLTSTTDDTNALPRLRNSAYRLSKGIIGAFCGLDLKLILYELGAFHRRRNTRVDLEIIIHGFVNSIELPSRQSDQSIAAPAFAGLENVQRHEDTDHEDVEVGEEAGIFHTRAAQHDVVDDEVVALSRQRGNGVSHPAQGSLANRSGPDDDLRLAIIEHGFVCEAVGMIVIGLGEHRHEGIHLDVQEGRGRDRL